MNARSLQTRRGVRVRVLEAGSPGATPLVFMHGLMGLLEDSTFLDLLARRYHVFAPELPGYGESRDEELLEDMLDFTLHGWDVVDALQLERPVVVGHSLGGMIAAEMAALAPAAIEQLVLVDPFGVWLDEAPIPDLFALLPFEFGDYLFHDPVRAGQLLRGATDVAEPDVLVQFFVDNARQLGTAGKILFPIPNRRLSKRTYRLVTSTLVVWAEHDRLMPASAYTARWQALLPNARAVCIADCGHMLPYEQAEQLAATVLEFLACGRS
jgi:pimeloyl-ACP methyl ester carboxylesterase